jgi:hypothetical protein
VCGRSSRWVPATSWASATPLGELEARRGRSADAEAWKLGYDLSTRRYDQAYGTGTQLIPEPGAGGRLTWHTGLCSGPGGAQLGDGRLYSDGRQFCSAVDVAAGCPTLPSGHEVSRSTLISWGSSK